MSLQSEFTADEMGKITEILVKNRSVDINRSAFEDYINILIDCKTTDVNVGELSDDDFRDFFSSINNPESYIPKGRNSDERKKNN